MLAMFSGSIYALSGWAGPVHRIRPVCFVLMGLLVSVVPGGWLSEAKATDLPAIEVRGLADLVASYETRISKLQTKASLVYGTAPGDNVTHGSFTPNDPPYSLTQESALDLVNSAEYVKQRQLTQGQYDNAESAFDGKIGTRLIGGDDRRKEMLGRLTEKRPLELSYDEVHHPRPAEAAYWPIPGRSLSEMIRTGSNVQIKNDVIDGMSCYSVTILSDKVVTFSHEGKTMTGKANQLYRAWLAPSRNMLPVRFDSLSQTSADDMEGTPTVIRYQSDFREVEPGIWFPFASRRCRMWVGMEPTVTAMTVEEVKVNDKAEVTTRIDFLGGTHMTDEITGIKYRVGLTPGDIDSMIEDITSPIELDSVGDSADVLEATTSNRNTNDRQPGAGRTQLPLAAVESHGDGGPWRLVGWAFAGVVLALLTFVVLARGHLRRS